MLGYALIGMGLTASAHAQTARDYFNELKAANTFRRYGDIYACFPDDNTPSFAVVARVSDVINAMKKAGNTDGAKRLAQAKDSLFVQTYYKGVGDEEDLFDPVKKNMDDENKKYQVEFKAPFRGRITYSINWPTGRYRLAVYMFQRSRIVPNVEASGRCELIHPAHDEIPPKKER